MDTKILIITDDTDTKKQLVQSLVRIQAWILAIPTEPGSLCAYLDQADLLILDVPQADTIEFGLLAKIRKLSTVPVILLVPAGDYRIGIRGLDHGADYVMAKPANEKELKARIRALLRRVQAPHLEPESPQRVQPVLVPEARPTEHSPH